MSTVIPVIQLLFRCKGDSLVVQLHVSGFPLFRTAVTIVVMESDVDIMTLSPARENFVPKLPVAVTV